MNKLRGVTLFILLALFGCDSFHIASVRIPEKILVTKVEVKYLDSLDIAKDLLKEFSSQVGFICNDNAIQGELLSCGPAWHRGVNLYKDDQNYVFSLLDGHPGWGKSEYFCTTQKKLHSFFANKFGTNNIIFKTNDPCVE